jgi:hypothetical protein
MAEYPYTLLIVGQPNTFEYLSDEKEVVVGNGGAPLASSSADYGYLIAAQQSDGSLVFTEYDYNGNAVADSFTVQ